MRGAMARGASDRIDFAALRMLKVVSEFGSISIAARRLDLDQSTISHTLGRLRKLFGDPLLVPGLHGMTPTERCRTIVGELGHVLDSWNRLSAPRRFQPRTAQFEVVIAARHTGRTILFGPLVAFLRRFAPGIRLRFILSQTTPFDALETGLCDIAILPMSTEPIPYRRRFLMTFDHVCVVASNGPYAAGITADQYLAASHAFKSQNEHALRSRLREVGLLSLVLPSLADIDLLIENTDLVATVPEPLARLLREKVTVLPLPFPFTSNLHMFWSDRTHEALHMRWLRMLVADIAGAVARNEKELALHVMGEGP